MWLKYYEKEHARWPQLNPEKGRRQTLTREEAEVAIKKLARHFAAPMPKIEFTSGNRTSRAGSWRIRLNVDYMTWGVLAHE